MVFCNLQPVSNSIVIKDFEMENSKLGPAENLRLAAKQTLIPTITFMTTHLDVYVSICSFPVNIVITMYRMIRRISALRNLLKVNKITRGYNHESRSFAPIVAGHLLTTTKCLLS